MLSAVKQTPDGVLGWSPQTDLRNCGLPLILRTIQELVLVAQTEPIAADHLVFGVERFVLMIRLILEDPDLGPEAAREGSGYAAIAPEYRRTIEAALGRQAIGMVIFACRAAAIVGEEPPYKQALAELVAGGAAVAEALR
jgi:hypothetical protein